MRKVPALATWLLRRFGVAAPLIGDLSEAYQEGMSSMWYWRQALVAIATGLGRDCRTLSLAAVVAGWISFMALHAALWLQGPFRFRLHAGPVWVHWAIAFAFAAVSAFFAKPWDKVLPSGTQLAFKTFFWCLALDWPLSTFWSEPVSSTYLTWIGIEFLGIALLDNVRAIVLRPKSL